MTKSELIEKLRANQSDLPAKDVAGAVDSVLTMMSDAISKGDRVEIRGFGSFSLHRRAPRVGRNPKTGEPVVLGARFAPHFKAGKALRERVDAGREGETADPAGAVRARPAVRTVKRAAARGPLAARRRRR